MLVTRCVECNHEELSVNSGCLCACHVRVESARTPAERIAELEARLAQAEETLKDETEVMIRVAAQRDAVEAQLAMAYEALDSIWAAVGDRLCAGKSLSKSYGQGVMKDVKRAQEATAPDVAAFIERTERRGAARELRRVADPKNGFHVGVREWAEARAAELEGA